MICCSRMSWPPAEPEAWFYTAQNDLKIEPTKVTIPQIYWVDQYFVLMVPFLPHAKIGFILTAIMLYINLTGAFVMKKGICLKAEGMLKYWKILLLGAAMFVYFIGVFINIVADPDLWGYLAFGRLFWESGYFPFHDVFSYIPTKEIWVYHEWLTGVLFFPIVLSL